MHSAQHTIHTHRARTHTARKHSTFITHTGIRGIGLLLWLAHAAATCSANCRCDLLMSPGSCGNVGDSRRAGGQAFSRLASATSGRSPSCSLPRDRDHATPRHATHAAQATQATQAMPRHARHARHASHSVAIFQSQIETETETETEAETQRTQHIRSTTPSSPFFSADANRGRKQRTPPYTTPPRNKIQHRTPHRFKFVRAPILDRPHGFLCMY